MSGYNVRSMTPILWIHRYSEYSVFKFNFILCILCRHTSPRAQAQVRRPLSGVGFLLLPYRSQGLDSGLQTCTKVGLSHLASPEYIRAAHATSSRDKTPAQICGFPCIMSHYLMYTKTPAHVGGRKCIICKTQGEARLYAREGQDS